MKKTTVLYVIIVILLIAIIGGITYLVIDNNQENNQPVENNSQPQENTNQQKEETKEQTLKLDNSKDWVYDAEYEKNVTQESYTTYYDETYYAKDIIVPYININSNAAKQANDEIKAVFDEAIATYNEGVNDKQTLASECNYTKYLDTPVLSVLLTYGGGSGTDVIHSKYYTYNFDINSGNALSYQDIYTSLGYTSDSVNEKAKEAITKIMEKELEGLKDPATETGDGAYYPDGTNFDYYNNASIKNYEESVTNNTIKYFIDTNKKLNVIVTLNIPAGSEEFDTIITLD